MTVRFLSWVNGERREGGGQALIRKCYEKEEKLGGGGNELDNQKKWF